MYHPVSNKNSKGSVGTSKGFGFVAYTSHESALSALRKINNNPLVFTKEQRPIIEFSIENKTALNARQKRLQKSREKNPLWKGNKLENDPQTTKHVIPKVKEEIDNKPSFMGSANNPKQKNLPSHEGAKVRHNRSTPKITRRDLKKKEQEKRNPKKRKHNGVESMESQNAISSSGSKRAKIEEKENKTKRLSRKQAKKQKS
jgi:nucleolar protein 4